MADATTPGSETSEFKLANRASWLGTAMIVVGGFYDVLTALSSILPQNHFVAATLVVLGAVVKLSSTLGYTISRTAVKTAVDVAPVVTLEDAAKVLAGK